MNDKFDEIEARLKEATIGEPALLNDKVALSPYDPDWARTYEQLARLVHSALGDVAMLLEHVGSTSIPGITAKPVIDMVLEVPDSRLEETYVPQLEAAGFIHRNREPDWYEHRLLRTEDPRSNLHVFSAGCEETKRMLRFRDWLREHRSDREYYQAKKLELANRVWKYMQFYASAKSEVIEEILNRAS